MIVDFRRNTIMDSTGGSGAVQVPEHQDLKWDNHIVKNEASCHDVVRFDLWLDSWHTPLTLPQCFYVSSLSRNVRSPLYSWVQGLKCKILSLVNNAETTTKFSYVYRFTFVILPVSCSVCHLCSFSCGSVLWLFLTLVCLVSPYDYKYPLCFLYCTHYASSCFTS